MTEASDQWVETPEGIFTAEGLWFHVAVSDLTSFAPDVVSRYEMDGLLSMATSWVRLPQTMGILSLAAFLPGFEWWQAALGSVLVWLFLSVASPSTVVVAPLKALRFLHHPVVQGLIYVLVLSAMASSGNNAALATGLTGFILFRWQIVSRALNPIADRLRKPLSPLAVTDTILRNLTMRLALRHGYDVGGTADMQRRMLEIMHYRRNRAKN